jgi:methionyl-tRNA formyltransferase
MLMTVSCPIGARSRAGELHDALAVLGPPALLEVLGELPRLQQHAQAQDDTLASYAHKILKSEAQLDWSRSAVELDRKIRAFNPVPGCHSLLGGQRVKVWEARPLASAGPPVVPGTIVRAGNAGIAVSCGAGELLLEVLQLDGGRALAVQQLLSAHHAQFAVGKQFDPHPPGES